MVKERRSLESELKPHPLGLIPDKLSSDVAREVLRMGHRHLMTPKTNSFKNPGLASIRSRKNQDSYFSNRSMASVQILMTDQEQILSRASPPLPFPREKLKKGLVPTRLPKTTSFISPGLASIRSHKKCFVAPRAPFFFAAYKADRAHLTSRQQRRIQPSLLRFRYTENRERRWVRRNVNQTPSHW